MNSKVVFILIVLFSRNHVNMLMVNRVPIETIQFNINQYKTIRISEKMCDLYSANINKLRAESSKTLNEGLTKKPYVALIGWKSTNEISWDCTGFLVSENFVITAAHCVGKNLFKKIKKPPSYVRLGQHNISSTDSPESVDLKIKAIFTNPKRKKSKLHDIALIKFMQTFDFKFNEFVQPICLPAKSNYNIRKFLAYGWGKITKEFNEITLSKNIALSKTEVLKEVKLEEISDEHCSSTFNNKWYYMFDKNFNFCAKPINLYQDTCQGDSGGPIVITDAKKNIEIAIGITNRGYTFCNNESYKPIGIYLRLFPYLNWIEQTVWKSISN